MHDRQPHQRLGLFPQPIQELLHVDGRWELGMFEAGTDGRLDVGTAESGSLSEEFGYLKSGEGRIMPKLNMR